MVVDPFNPFTTDLVVTGARRRDSISVVSAGNGKVDVTINGANYWAVHSHRANRGLHRQRQFGGDDRRRDHDAGLRVRRHAATMCSSTAARTTACWSAAEEPIPFEGGSGHNILIGGTGASRLTGGPMGIASGGSVMIGGVDALRP